MTLQVAGHFIYSKYFYHQRASTCMEQQVILVNEKDEITGTAGKMEAHEKGLLHRAFSVFIFDKQGRMLLQQRAMGKYHSGGLWSNACCSHPAPGEAMEQAAQKRLKEEMGLDLPVLKVFDFVYKANFSNGLVEHEYDHVFVGEYDGPVDFNKDEVMDCRYKTMQEIHSSLKNEPQNYTAWFKPAFVKIEDWWRERYSEETKN